MSEIGLLACKVQANEDDDPVEGYHILVGGGFGPNAALGRELFRDVVAEDAPRTIERILKAYLAHRASREETFLAFARRHEIDALQGDDRAGGRRMSMTPRPPIPSFIPESAPFTPEQRTWLNGLFAGLFGLQESVTPLSDRRRREAAWRACSTAPGAAGEPSMRPTMARPGTIRPCRCRIA